jgi:hypothetical protein
MIAKTFILTKEIRLMRAKSLRDNQSLRDHELARRDNSKKSCVSSRMADNSKKRGSAAGAPAGFAKIVDRCVHPEVHNDPQSRCVARKAETTA